MALWSVTSSSVCESDTEVSVTLAECVPFMEPIFHFSNLSTEPHTLASASERVRSLAYNSNNYVSSPIIYHQFDATITFIVRSWLLFKLIHVELIFIFGTPFHFSKQVFLNSNHKVIYDTVL